MLKAYIILAGVFMAGVLSTLAARHVWALGPAAKETAARQIELRVTDNQICKVEHVVDGDTVVLENGIHIRYRGVNAPETGYFLHDPAPWGMEAAARNRELLEGKMVRVSLGDPPMDAYGRVIARLYVPGKDQTPEVDVEAQLLREGLARVLPLGQRAAELDALHAAEEEARTKKSGLWSLSDDEPARRAQFTYACTANSRVFHKLGSGCAAARNISSAQFKGFTNLEEAVLTGRHLCSQCIQLQIKKSGKPAPEKVIDEAPMPDE